MANAIDQLTDRVLMLGRLTIVRRAITAVAVTISAVLQTFLIQAFIQPADLLPSGLTGVAVLLDRVTSLGGVHIDISLGMLALNIPVALLCWSGISKRFVIFSMMQVVLSSLFLNVFHFAPFLGDKIMLIIFGGVVSGLGAAIALKSGASTGGNRLYRAVGFQPHGQDHLGRHLWFQLLYPGDLWLYVWLGQGGVFHRVPVYFDQDHRQFLSSLRSRDAADYDAQGRRGHDCLRKPFSARH